MASRSHGIKIKETFTRYPGETVVNYSSPGGGGLIEFRIGEDDDGKPTLSVHLYRHDPSVTVTVGEATG